MKEGPLGKVRLISSHTAAASINNIFIILCFIKRNSFLRLSFNTYQIRSCFDFGKRKSPGSLLGVKLNLKFDVKTSDRLLSFFMWCISKYFCLLFCTVCRILKYFDQCCIFLHTQPGQMDIFSNTPLTLHFTEFNYIQPDSIKISPFSCKS